jgi:hypothetical protein
MRLLKKCGGQADGILGFDAAARVFGFSGRRACLFGRSGTVGCGNVQMYVGLKSEVLVDVESRLRVGKLIYRVYGEHKVVFLPFSDRTCWMNDA